MEALLKAPPENVSKRPKKPSASATDQELYQDLIPGKTIKEPNL